MTLILTQFELHFVSFWLPILGKITLQKFTKCYIFGAKTEVGVMELKAVSDISAQIENTKSKLQQIEDSIQRLTRANDGLPKSKLEDRLGDLISLKVDVQAELTSLEKN